MYKNCSPEGLRDCNLFLGYSKYSFQEAAMVTA